MVKRGKKNTNSSKSLLPFLEFAFFALVTSLFYVLYTMVETGFEILDYLPNIVFLYLPIFYAGWIVKFVYDHEILLSKKNVRNAVWAAFIMIILLSLCNIGEISPLIRGEILTQKELIKEYMSNAVLHPLAFLGLVILLQYIRWSILGKKAPFVISLNICLSLVLLYTIVHHLYYSLTYLLEVAGFINEEGGINSLTVSIVLFAILVFILGISIKFLSKIRKKHEANVKKSHNKSEVQK